jgi:uncharacterized membrane protein
MAGTHDHGAAMPVSRNVNRLLAMAVAPFLLATVVGLVLLWPTGETQRNEAFGPPAALYDGTVVERTVRPCMGSSEDSPIQCSSVGVRLSEGPERDTTVEVEIGEGPGAPRVGDGDPVVLGRTQDETGTVTYYFADFQRRAPLLVLAGIFAFVVVLLGRKRGLAALAALVVSLLMIVKFVLPALLDGRSPLAVAIVGSAAIMFLALYLSHGVNAQTTTAVLGTLVSLALTGVLAAVFVAASRFTGLASEEAGFLQSAAGQINLRGLLLGGIVIGSLGVLDDVTVTQASAVWQLHGANNALSVRELYSAGLRIGRDHIASTVNTLVLAYAGASLPLLLLFTLARQPTASVLTGEVVAGEIVRTLVGSIGLVASVPITTALAAVVVARDRGVTAQQEVDETSPDAPRPRLPWRRPRGDAPIAPHRERTYRPPAAEREFWVDTDDD